MLDSLRGLVLDNPLVAFTTMLLVSLLLPPLFERLRLPGLVGLLLAGVLLGSSGLGVLEADGEIEKFFADVGKVYLMFVAALEIDLKEFSHHRDRALIFGGLTFCIPLLGGLGLGRMLGLGWNAAVLIGSLLASHTLLAYPIVLRLGVAREESVTVTVGATIFTDIAALLVLAVCVSVKGGDFSAATLTLQLIALGLYAAAVLFGLDWLGKLVFRRTGDEQGNKFLFILLAVFLAAVGAQIINIDKVVGAFLAGLAVNDVVGDGPVKEKVEFFGSVLFIPFFFICMGLLLDVPVLWEALTTRLGLTLGIVIVLIVTKFIAAAIAGVCFRYRWVQILTMWSLSLPQVAATLAAALVGLQAGLIDAPVFNAIIVLMVVTSFLGSIVTTHFARQLTVPAPPVPMLAPEPEQTWLVPAPAALPFTVVVPIANPLTQRNLIELAALLAKSAGGHIVPLAIAPAHVHMDAPALVTALEQRRELLQTAVAMSQQWGTPAIAHTRIDDDIAAGISRTAREQNAQLIVMGWSSTAGLRAKLFGTLIDNVFWAAHCPVAVTRLNQPPSQMHRLLIPVKQLTPGTVRTLRFGQVFAASQAATITVLHVCDRRQPPDDLAHLKAALHGLFTTGAKVEYTIKFVRHDDPAAVIITAARHVDLLLLRSMRRRTAGGLAVSDVTDQVLAAVTGSIVLFGEPHS